MYSNSKSSFFSSNEEMMRKVEEIKQRNERQTQTSDSANTRSNIDELSEKISKMKTIISSWE